MSQYQYLNDFFKIRTNCLFCEEPLDPIITNWFGLSKPRIPEIKAYIENDQFKFNLNYFSPNDNINTEVIVNCKNNIITFDNNSLQNFNHLSNDILKTNNSIILRYLDTLINMKTHIELQCNNKKCKMNYYMASDQFQYKIENDNIYIKPITLYMECFIINKFWVNSNYLNKSTVIIPINNSKIGESITFPIIDFNNLNQENIFNKIKTLVVFS